VSATPLVAQRGGRGRGGPPPTPRAAAPFDLTGYWVSIVTEDWRYRMVVPPKGNVLGVPLNAEGRRVANAWDPAKDTASGETCRAYGAAGLMRMPGRLHITWADDTTLRVDADAGTQTRVLRFGASSAAGAPAGAAPARTTPSWQGTSAAQWEIYPMPRGAARAGTLKVVTTGMRPGYLRRNGVPYSANAVLTEYYDRIVQPDGTEWLVVLSEVNDPQYLTTPFTTTTHFKREPDGSKWMPTACE
jgi:hypothetical protein